MKSNSKLQKGAWGHAEDKLLRKCIKQYGEGKWHLVPQRAGLNRCRKSCRLRWLNYLKPSIKRGQFAEDEVDLITRLHKLLGNRWSLIAGRLPGRTANDVKNYWSTNIQKKTDAITCQKEAVKTVNSNISSAIFKPLPRTLNKGTSVSVPCYNQFSFVDNSLSAEDNIYNPNMLIDDKPLSPPIPTPTPTPTPVPDPDGSEWWKKLLDEVSIGGEDEQDQRLEDLLIVSSPAEPTRSTGAVEADDGNDWGDIWDILNADFNIK